MSQPLHRVAEQLARELEESKEEDRRHEKNPRQKMSMGLPLIDQDKPAGLQCYLKTKSNKFKLHTV